VPDFIKEVEMEIASAEYERLQREIASDASPVGIDAEKTHVLILHKLEQIERRLERLEARLARAPVPQSTAGS
jgi:hypothetical protein